MRAIYLIILKSFRQLFYLIKGKPNRINLNKKKLTKTTSRSYLTANGDEKTEQSYKDTYLYDSSDHENSAKESIISIDSIGKPKPKSPIPNHRNQPSISTHSSFSTSNSSLEDHISNKERGYEKGSLLYSLILSLISTC